MDTSLLLLSHLFSVGITILLFLFIVSIAVGIPYCRYAFFVSRANTSTGIENFAKYLANKSTVGAITPTDDIWKTFLPAAARLGEEHMEKRYHKYR